MSNAYSQLEHPGGWFDHQQYPIFHLGELEFPAPFLPPLVATFIFLSIGRYKTTTTNQPTTLTNEKGAHPTLSQSSQETHWVAGSFVAELQRISMFLLPLGGSFLLVNFCASCMGWRTILSGLPATPPSVAGGAFSGGVVYLLCWGLATVAFYDPKRAYRSPSTTLKRETHFCASVAAWTIVALLAGWGIVKMCFAVGG